MAEEKNPQEAGQTEAKESSNEYTDLFAKKAEGEKAENKASDSKLLDVAVKQSEGQTDKKKILNLKNEKLDTSAFIDQDYHLKKKLSFARGLFFTLLFTSLSVFSYFFVELHPTDFLHNYIDSSLEPNVTATLDNLNNKIVSTQTKINRNRHLIAKVHLDDFSLVSDSFLQDFEIYSSDDSSFIRDQADDRLFDMQKRLAENFETAKEKLLATNWVDFGADPKELNFNPEDENNKALKHKVHFIALLKEHFNERKDNDELKAVASEEEVNETLELIGNGELTAALRGNDFSEKSYEDVVEIIDAINSATTNDLSHIYKIKKDRINWSRVMAGINDVTEELDFYYRDDFYDQIGGIQYNNYQFDSDSGRIVVTGQIKTDDGTNFSVMANLIDKFEASDLFENVEMRSFAKSGTEDDGFNSTIKLDFSLQENTLDSRDENNVFDDVVETQSIDKSKKIPVKKPRADSDKNAFEVLSIEKVKVVPKPKTTVNNQAAKEIINFVETFDFEAAMNEARNKKAPVKRK